MSPESFCYFLQGYLEINSKNKSAPAGLTPEQVDCIRDHLGLVFFHSIDLKAGGPEVQQTLNSIRNPPGRPDLGGNGVMRC